MYLQPFANEAWFLRYTQEVAAVVDGYRQRAAERRTPVSSFFQPRTSPAVSTIRSSAAGLGLRGPAAPLSSRLSSAAISPVPSSLPAGSPAARLLCCPWPRRLWHHCPRFFLSDRCSPHRPIPLWRLPRRSRLPLTEPLSSLRQRRRLRLLFLGVPTSRILRPRKARTRSSRGSA
jgi:hypothetical protein